MPRARLLTALSVAATEVVTALRARLQPLKLARQGPLPGPGALQQLLGSEGATEQLLDRALAGDYPPEAVERLLLALLAAPVGAAALVRTRLLLDRATATRPPFALALAGQWAAMADALIVPERGQHPSSPDWLWGHHRLLRDVQTGAEGLDVLLPARWLDEEALIGAWCRILTSPHATPAHWVRLVIAAHGYQFNRVFVKGCGRPHATP